MRRFDAVVVGAGPAGCAAAMVLARAGRSVALVERQRLPRYKACGGGVVWRALQSLPCRRPGESDIPMLPLQRVAVHHGGGEPVIVERSVPPVTMVMRADFDHFLAERACEAGATRLESIEIAEIRPADGAFTCTTTDGDLRAPVVIGADGAESRVARAVPGATGRLGVALEGELLARQTPSPEARFDFAVLPEGYGWVFPKISGTSIGVFSRRGRYPALRAAYAGYRALRGLGEAAEERLTGHRIPVVPRRVRGRGGLLLAGDAAGLADPLTGEGISYAIRSGRRAAEAVLRAGREPQRSAAEYERGIADLLAEIRAARWLAALLYGVPGGSFRLFRRRRAFAEAIVDVFAGRRTYRELLRRAARRPWRLVA